MHMHDHVDTHARTCTRNIFGHHIDIVVITPPNPIAANNCIRVFGSNVWFLLELLSPEFTDAANETAPAACYDILVITSPDPKTFCFFSFFFLAPLHPLTLQFIGHLRMLHFDFCERAGHALQVCLFWHVLGNVCRHVLRHGFRHGFRSASSVSTQNRPGCHQSFFSS